MTSPYGWTAVLDYSVPYTDYIGIGHRGADVPDRYQIRVIQILRSDFGLWRTP